MGFGYGILRSVHGRIDTIIQARDRPAAPVSNEASGAVIHGAAQP